MNRDRYSNSILRSNSDIGALLEETFPDKVLEGSTSYMYSVRDKESELSIYYIPVSRSDLLRTSEIDKFIDTKKAYYVTSNLTIVPGIEYTVKFIIDLELYKMNDDNYEELIGTEILKKKFENQFNLSFDDLEEVNSEIYKIPNVKRILSIKVEFIGEGEDKVVDLGDIDFERTYFKVKSEITAGVKI